MASPLLAVPLLIRFAATPWYLGGSLAEDTLAVLSHTSWQFLLLGYHTLTFLREPVLFGHVLLVGWWFAKHYGLPDVPIPQLSQPELSLSCSRPRVSLLGHWFEPQLLFSPGSRLTLPEPLPSLLGCWTPTLPSPSGLLLLPCPPGLPLPPLPGSGSSPSVWLFQISLSIDFDLSWLCSWWSLADLIVPVPHSDAPLLLPGYYQQWRQFYQMSKFFSELFTGGHMPIG